MELKKDDSCSIQKSSFGFISSHSFFNCPWHRVQIKQEIPLVVLSVDAHKTPKEHYEFGKKLRELREEGYLILGSGNIVHNLGLVDFQKENGYDWAEEFDNEIKNSILSKKLIVVSFYFLIVSVTGST